ncbi:MAG: hypothetical protein WCR52_10145 [Bacteroidota bacterium]
MTILKENANVFRSAPPNPGRYYPDDLISLLKQAGADSLEEVLIEFPLGQHQFISAVIAKNATGNLLDGATNLLGLPCPPYCMQAIMSDNTPTPLNSFSM